MTVSRTPRTDPRPPSAAGAAAPAAPRRAPLGLVVLLGTMAALGAVTVDLYLPSLPDVAADLRTSEATTQLTITGVMVGAGLGQLIVGPLSDAFGRRRPAVAGLAVYVVACLLCAVAPTVEVLVALRVLAGVGASAGAVVGMAVVRDLFTGPAAARLMSRIVLVIGVAPLFAPTVGGAVAGFTGWRTVLALLAVAGLVVLLAVARKLPETRPDAPAVPAPRSGERAAPAAVRRRLVATSAAYGALLRDRRFVATACLPGLCMAVVMSYVSTSPFVLPDRFGLDGHAFALFFAFTGTAMVGGSQLNAALVERHGSVRLLRVGVVATLAGAVLLAAAIVAGAGLPLFAAALYATLLPLGLVMPNAVTLALAEHGARAGSAAALVTALQSGLGGGVGVLTGLLGGDAAALAGVVVGAAALNLVLGLLVTRRG